MNDLERAMYRRLHNIKHQRRMSYLRFRFNFRAMQWGKMGSLWWGLPIEAAFLVCLVAPGLLAGADAEPFVPWMLRGFGAIAQAVLTYGHWRNFKGLQA